MPTFLDTHKRMGLSEDTLRHLQDAPRDEFGVKHINLFYSETEDKLFCLLDAPDKEAVMKHHEKAGITPDWITEVKTTA
jgi:L-rhamnose mutarotase